MVSKIREDAEYTERFYISLCSRCTLWLIFELFHPTSVFTIICHLLLDIRLRCLCSPCLPSRSTSQPASGCSICWRRPWVLVGAANGGYCYKNIQFMKYCIKKDAKLRLQCLCELCALCGKIKRKQTLNPHKSQFCTQSAAHPYKHTPTACVRS